MKKRVTYRPSKAQGVFSVIWGGVFVLIGLFLVVPVFGAVGILWTLGAIAITAMNGYRAFGKKYTGPEIRIEDDSFIPREVTPRPDSGTRDLEDAPYIGLSPQKRLEQLNVLRDAGLLTDQEYQEKRREVLRDL